MRRKYRLVAPHVIAELAPDVMAGLDPAIGYPHQFANDAIPVSNRVKPSHDVLACGSEMDKRKGDDFGW